MPEFIAYLLIIATTFFLTKLIRHYLLKNKLIDIPNERSSHSLPTPRGGGISIIIVFFISLSYFWYFIDNQNNDLVMSIFFGGSLVAIIGFWDDLHHVPARWRLLVHLIAAFISLNILSTLPSISFFLLDIDFSTFAIVVYSILLVWTLNLYNFMDGIDGIASVEAITVLLSATIIIYLHGSIDNVQILLLLSGCVIGFLLLNWPPAKIFMGDACSGFLGFTLGLLAIATSNSEAINIWSWTILLAVFIVDATYTLIRRIVKADKWYEAHRSHAYQIFARRFNSHKKVSVGVLVINTLWLFPLAYFAAITEFWAPLITLVALLPLVYVVQSVGAGTKNN